MAFLAANAATNANVWGQWNQIYFQGTTTANTILYTSQAWQNWNNQYQGTAVSYGGYTTQQQQPQLTEQEIRTANEQLEASRLRHSQAQTRAKEILVSMLNDNQKKQFETDSSFELQVNDRLYRIKPGHTVSRLNPITKKVESTFCIHPAYHHELPAEDVALGQKLLLEADEKQFLKIANETRAA